MLFPLMAAGFLSILNLRATKQHMAMNRRNAAKRKNGDGTGLCCSKNFSPPYALTHTTLAVILETSCHILLRCSFDFANSVYSAVVLGLMGPLLVNGLAKKKTYGKIAQCSSTGDIPDENYTQALTTIQNYRVICSLILLQW